jgi:hydrogenase/urease accessory protein HupE
MKWLLIIFVLFCAPARADEMRPAYIEFTQTNTTNWQLFWKVPLNSGLTPQSEPLLPDGCTVIGEPQREIFNMALLAKSQVSCTKSVLGASIGVKNFDPLQTDVFVRVAPIGSAIQSFRLSQEKPIAQIKAKASRWQVAQSYLITGIQHIITGYDHLLFVCALVLLLLKPWPIAKAATAFTIAHSVTLIGSTLGLIGLPQRPVEALIALSIIFMAVEIVKKDPAKTRLSEQFPWVIAFIFGLIHGFGFAGALREIGLPEGEVPMALLTFNLGVEVGQLIIVFGVLLFLSALKKMSAKVFIPVEKIASYLIGIIASYWFIERVLT